MPSITQRQPAPTPVTDTVPLPREVPDLPEDVFQRFPSLRDWQEKEDAWWNRAYNALQDQNRTVAQTVSSTQQNARTLRVSFNQFRAEVTEEIDAIVDATGALARRIVTVSAMAGVPQNIKVQTTAPGTPSVGDYWIDTSDLTLPITYQWDGADWVEVTTQISFAGVADERTARVTADGYLEGKYTLVVTAGTVITGVNITSASGPGTNISNVAWTADQFQIYSGTAKKTMFVADAVQDKVRMAGVFTVDGATTSIYIKTTAGAGSYNSAGTPFFVDNTGRMSLGTGLVFDGSNLTITGAITADSGSIGGWTILSSTLSRNNAILDSAGQLVLGTSNDVVYLSATDSTYRIWIGNVTAGSASFRVTKGGTMTATNGVFSGSVTSTSGSIGGFTLGATTLTGTNITINANGGSGILVGPTISDCTVIAYAGLFDGVYKFVGGIEMWAWKTSGGGGQGRIQDSGGATTITLTGNGGVVSATTFSGSGTSLTGVLKSANNLSDLGSAASARSNLGVTATGSDTTYAFRSNDLSDLNSASTARSNLGLGSIATQASSSVSITGGNITGLTSFSANGYFFVNSGAPSTDIAANNLRVFSDAARTSQTARIDAATGFYYVQGNQVVGARGTRGAAGLTEVVALLDAWGAWA